MEPDGSSAPEGSTAPKGSGAPVGASEPVVLRPLRVGAHKALALPVLFLAVGLLTQSQIITLVGTMWTIFGLIGVLLSRAELDDDGLSVRLGLLSRHARWSDIQAVYLATGAMRRRTVVVETSDSVLRLPAPPTVFRSDEPRLALQLALVDSWWHSRRGKKWKRATSPSRATKTGTTAKGGSAPRGGRPARG